MPPGAKSICIGADGTGGCRIEQNKIYWQSDEKDQLHFVNYPHGVGCKCCFRACIRGSDGSWVPLTLKQFPLQTSAVTVGVSGSFSKYLKKYSSLAGREKFPEIYQGNLPNPRRLL